jgi:hypothetical protein
LSLPRIFYFGPGVLGVDCTLSTFSRSSLFPAALEQDRIFMALHRNKSGYSGNLIIRDSPPNLRPGRSIPTPLIMRGPVDFVLDGGRRKLLEW